MTPMQRMTGKKPDADQMTRHRYGALTIFPRVDKGNHMHETNFEVGCVVASP